jgi:surface antigen
LALSLASGGCSYRLSSFMGNDDADQSDITGSVTPAPKPAAAAPAENDLAYARAAATKVLARGGKDASARWENPRTGARGTVTPLADAYTQDGSLCRDFLASYVHEGSEAWLQGEACRRQQGRWEVKSLKPWTRS